MGRYAYIFAAISFCIVAILAPSAFQRIVVFGMTRRNLENHHGSELHMIPDTVQCEDMHYHEPSGSIFATCQDEPNPIFDWWPPLAVFDRPLSPVTGSIHVIDPSTFTSRRLRVENFNGPFVVHGIDLWSSSPNSAEIYIFAVNHLPDPEYVHALTSNASTQGLHKTKSQIEIFKHTLGSETATHISSIAHPLVRTPNDIFALDASSFYVTNDHYYREGVLRLTEDLLPPSVGTWSDIVHVSQSADGNVAASIALQGLLNPNGMGRSANANEIIFCSAVGGLLYIAEKDSLQGGANLSIVSRTQFDSTLDNPSYFKDPYAKETGRDASGFVLAGLARAVDLALAHTFRDPNGVDPAIVWLGRPLTNDEGTGAIWEKKLIFQDDSKTIRSGTTALIIAIDPKKNSGKKEGWLFVTGFLSHNIIATKIDL